MYPSGFPRHFVKGKGCIVQDVAEKEYIDFVMALGGAGVLGYADEQVVGSVFGSLKTGSLFSMASTLEVEVAERLREIYKYPKWRFFCTGSEACSASIRIARAYTRKMPIVSDGYHGWHDPFTSLTSPSIGVPIHKSMQTLAWTDSMEYCAGMIIEPVQLDISSERKKYLKDARKLCDKYKALLIFDEVVTGFRFPKYSVSNYWDVRPDMLILGKAIGGGASPLAAVGMTDEVANKSGEWFCSSTFAGNTLALAGCLKTLDILKDEKPLKWLWDRGGRFLDAFNKLTEPVGVRIEGYNTRGMLDMTNPDVAIFAQQMMKAGVLLGKAWFFTFPHTEVEEQVLSITADVVKKIKTEKITYEGEYPKETFKR